MFYDRSQKSCREPCHTVRWARERPFIRERFSWTPTDQLAEGFFSSLSAEYCLMGPLRDRLDICSGNTGQTESILSYLSNWHWPLPQDKVRYSKWYSFQRKQLHYLNIITMNKTSIPMLNHGINASCLNTFLNIKPLEYFIHEWIKP